MPPSPHPPPLSHTHPRSLIHSLSHNPYLQHASTLQLFPNNDEAPLLLHFRHCCNNYLPSEVKVLCKRRKRNLCWVLEVRGIEEIMGSPATLTLGPQASGDSSQKLASYLRNLQGERGKIEAFKRELPLCMELLDAAIESTKQRVMTMDDVECSDRTTTTQEFMPLKKRWERRTSEEEVVMGRPAWMGEAHLWTKHQHQQQQHLSSVEVNELGIDQGSGKAQGPRLVHREGGAFVPFTRQDRQQVASPPFSPPAAAPVPAASVPDAGSLSLSTTTTSTVPTASTVPATAFNGGDSEENTRVRDSSDGRVFVEYAAAQTRGAAAQPQRKARRCWSPELHRRFVSALQQLGGSQVATPKQIRELMKVDGLTNDEVKSHLQKYRLHTRRSSPSPTPSPSSSHAPPQLLILGWVPPPPDCTPPPPAAAVGAAASQASTGGGVCDEDPTPPALQLEHTPHQSLRGGSPGRGGELPHSSSDSYMDDSDDEQQEALKSTTSSSHKQHSHSSDEKSEQQQVLQLQSKGSTTCLPDIDTITRNHRTSSITGKLQTFRKAKAAA